MTSKNVSTKSSFCTWWTWINATWLQNCGSTRLVEYASYQPQRGIIKFEPTALTLIIHTPRLITYTYFAREQLPKMSAIDLESEAKSHGIRYHIRTRNLGNKFLLHGKVGASTKSDLLQKLEVTKKQGPLSGSRPCGQFAFDDLGWEGSHVDDNDRTATKLRDLQDVYESSKRQPWFSFKQSWVRREW